MASLSTTAVSDSVAVQDFAAHVLGADTDIKINISAAGIDTSTQEQLFQLYFTTGLQWEEVAVLFQENPQQLNCWMSGQRVPMHAQTHLQRISIALRSIQQAFGPIDRSLLLSKFEGNRSVFGLLRDHKYNEVLDLLRSGPGRKPDLPPEMCVDARAYNGPQYSPRVYVSPLENIVAPPIGRVRGIKRKKRHG